MSDKEAVLEAIRHLPDDASLDDIRTEVALLAKIREGIADAEAGRVVPHEQIERELRTWTTN